MLNPTFPLSLEPGDLVQIRYQTRQNFGHTPVVVGISGPPIPQNIYVAAHSFDANWRQLSTYDQVEEFRYIHIEGFRYIIP